MFSTAAADARQGAVAALQEAARTLTTDELLDVIEEAQRDIDAAHARQAVALAHLSAIESVRQEDGTMAEVHQGLGNQRMDAPELAAPRMGVSTQVATTRVGDAIALLTRAPIALEAMASGVLDARRAAVVTDGTDFLDADQAAVVVEAVAGEWAGVTVGPLKTMVARTAATLFPDAVAAEVDRVRHDRSLIKVSGMYGTDEWQAELPSERSALAWAAVTHEARKLVREGDYQSLTQARADALTGLILEHSDVRVVVHATRPATEHELTGHVGSGDVPEPFGSDEPTAGLPSRAPVPGSVAATPMAGAATPTAGVATRTAEHAATPTNDAMDHAAVTTTTAVWCEVGGLGRTGTTFVPAEFLSAGPPDRESAPGAESHDLANSAVDTGAATGVGVATGAGAATGVGAAPGVGAATGGVLVCHPVTGALVGGDVPAGLGVGRRDLLKKSTETSATYRIPAAMVRFVRLRDGGCRFPGCTVPARQCDIDHVRPWPWGPTSPINLHCLCRRHHRIKQLDGWSPRLHPNGTVTWTDPSGRTSTTSPVDHLNLTTTTALPQPQHQTQPHAPVRGAEPAVADMPDNDSRMPVQAPAFSGPAHRSRRPFVAGCTEAKRLHAHAISLLEEKLDERALLHARRHRPRTHYGEFGEPPPPMAIDHHPAVQATRRRPHVVVDVPPREAPPDVIPF